MQKMGRLLRDMHLTICIKRFLILDTLNLLLGILLRRLSQLGRLTVLLATRMAYVERQ